MQVNQLSSNSLATGNPYLNPYAKTTENQPNATEQTAQDARKPFRSEQTDTVTISQQALKMTSGSEDKPETAKNATAAKPQPGSFRAQA